MLFNQKPLKEFINGQQEWTYMVAVPYSQTTFSSNFS